MGNAFTTIARAFRGGMGPRPARAYLIPLDIHNADVPLTDAQRSFQYFPASISDTQATNYQTKVIPGLSHPLYQWTSGGARIISFEAIFSRDRTYTNEERDAIANANGSRSISNMGAGLNGVQQALGSMVLGIMSNSDPRNVDIPSAVAWLRSHLLPEYSVDGDGVFGEVPSRPLPPRKLILGIPGLRINWGVPTLPPTEVYVIMVGCEVGYDAFFHDGSPRIAKVSLSFAEIIQVGGRIVVQDAGNKRGAGLGGYTLNEKKTKG